MPVIEVGQPGLLLDAVYTDVLAPAFPAEERVTLDSFRTGVAEAGISVIAVVGEDGAPMAGAVGKWSPPTGVALLAYLAVRQDARSRGLGGTLLSQAMRLWQQRWQPCAVLAELEHPAAHTASPAHGDPAARLRFYGRHGARGLDLPYFQPALRPESSRVYGLILSVLALSDECRGSAPDTVAGEPIRRFLVDYLSQTEGKVSEDSACAALFHALARPAGVPLLVLDDPSTLPCSKPCS
ncbi:MAG TPA: GNAT family N-acetyltransferase [Micromonosporaceae bacterium]|nr:GNAT family N-acetyltransferase [Micromonosporaceae bacterium]